MRIGGVAMTKRRRCMFSILLLRRLVFIPFVLLPSSSPSSSSSSTSFLPRKVLKGDFAPVLLTIHKFATASDLKVITD
jgi:hypothetical protein